ncbi:MAG: hypothetical protein ACT4PE_09445 [Candidatus Eiseniibacteriota bacterium]
MTGGLLVLLLAAAPVMRAAVDTTATTVGGTLDLTLSVDAEEDWVVAPPARELDLKPFRLRAVEPLPAAEGTGWKLRIVALEAGEVAIPAVTLEARGPDGEISDVASEPVPVSVASNLEPSEARPAGEGGATQGEDAPPAEAAEPEPAALKPALDAPRNWAPLIIAAVAAVVATALGFWILRKLRRRRALPTAVPQIPKTPLRPAWETALEELDRIAAADYVGQGMLDRQYVEVTEALRRYLEERYGVPALESTTADLGELLQRTPIRTENSVRILSLLREADLVKFAKARPEAGAARATEGRARDVVLATVPKVEAAEAAA